MAYNEFKPVVFAQQIQRDLDKYTVLDKDCNHDFAGEIKKGESVTILGAERVQMKEYQNTMAIDIDNPEEMDGTNIKMLIDQMNYFNIGITDIDKVRTIKGGFDGFRKEATVAAVEKYESNIAKEASDAGHFIDAGAIATKEDLKKAIDEALVFLWDNGVYQTRRHVIELSPWAYGLILDEVIELSTKNHVLLKDGDLGMYKGAFVKMCNIMDNDGTDDLLMVRTDKAIAAGKQIDHVKGYEPEKNFGYAIKGLCVSGTKVVRPKELVTIKAHAA